MRLSKGIVQLIFDLEYEIGKECYNPSSTDGWTGYVGRSLRYPVSYRASKNDEEPTKTRYNINRVNHKISKDMIDTMKYVFGANHLYIGEGLVNVLNTLEERYGLDFNKLEKERE